MRTLDRSRPGIAAQAVGIAQGALEVAAALRDASASQFGKPIGEFQMIAGDARRHGRRRPRPPASSCTRPATEIEAGRAGRRPLVGDV